METSLELKCRGHQDILAHSSIVRLDGPADMAAIADIRSAGTSGVSVMVQRTRNVHIGHVLLFRGFLRDRVLSPRLHGTATDWSWRNIFDDANVHSVVGRVYLAYSVVQNLERETDWWANSSGVVRGWQAPVLLGESEAGH
eukprot:3634004-Pyramimonas_sp.AAC.1